MTSILEAVPYPFGDRQAQDLHVALTRLYPSATAALSVAERAGLDTAYLNPQQPPVYLWREVLLLAAQGGRTRDVVATARELAGARSPAGPFLDDVLAGVATPTDGEPRDADGSPVFLKGDDSIAEPEALLYQDDLTVQIGRVPALIETLRRLVELAPAVCRLAVDRHGAGASGTGFRISAGLILTNWHVLHDRRTADRPVAVTAEFGYEDDGRGGALAPTVVPCDVASIVGDEDDDWAVIAASQPLRASWPILRLSQAADPVVHEPAHIVQHPQGDRKRLAFVRNQVSWFDDLVLHYLTDTQAGSSGAPVFGAGGRLIGLHHAGGLPREVIGRPPLSKNEGVRIPRVVAGLRAQGIETP